MPQVVLRSFKITIKHLSTLPLHHTKTIHTIHKTFKDKIEITQNHTSYNPNSHPQLIVKVLLWHRHIRHMSIYVFD